MRFLLPAILAMGSVVVASNILVQFRLGEWLTWGAMTYPFAFLVTDITNRIHGAAAARRVVLFGFLVGIVCSLIAAGAGTTTVRIALASGAAFLIAQMIDVAIFERLRHVGWWQAPFLSSVVGSALDTLLFFGIAFAAFLPHDANTGWATQGVPLLGAGPLAPVWASLGMADWLVKILLAALALVPFRMAIDKILSRPA
ncbi:VUT family protein [Paracoccus marinus]|uniref:VUT family protein n=1 Tax=Paracoccus marinus TaxID=288426 RepID=UPI00103C76C6|nr:VUT family protein [Paracoccus marinus]GLS80895.1 membrane protein [Paracoccus marinus]